MGALVQASKPSEIPAIGKPQNILISGSTIDQDESSSRDGLHVRWWTDKLLSNWPDAYKQLVRQGLLSRLSLDGWRR